MASISTLQDPFVSTGLNTNLWTQFTGGSATLSYGNGATATYPASSTSSTDGDLSSNTTYNLTSSRAFIQVLVVPSSSTSADAELRLKIDNNNYLRWVAEAGTLYAQYRVTGSTTTPFSVAYNAITHAWWQIRETAGTVYWETSTDGITWTIRGSVADPIVVTGLTVLIAATCFQNETNPGTYTWRNFNTVNESNYAQLPSVLKAGGMSAGVASN